MLSDETFICTRYQKLTEKHPLLLQINQAFWSKLLRQHWRVHQQQVQKNLIGNSGASTSSESGHFLYGVQLSELGTCQKDFEQVKKCTMEEQDQNLGNTRSASQVIPAWSMLPKASTHHSKIENQIKLERKELDHIHHPLWTKDPFQPTKLPSIHSFVAASRNCQSILRDNQQR